MLIVECLTGTRIRAWPFLLATGFMGSAHGATCDIDRDGDIDREDIKRIVVARDTRATDVNDPRDADGNGKITMLDARACIRRCNLPNCKVVQPMPSPAIEDPGQTELKKTVSADDATDNASSSTSTPPGQQSDSRQQKALRGDNTWEVKRGDTLYAIGRAIFPGNSARQARLRQDIVRLNPTVFANGANNMDVGVILRLPEYADDKDAQVEAKEPVTQQRPAAVVEPSESSQVPPASPAVITPEPTTVPSPKPAPERISKVEDGKAKTADKANAGVRSRSTGSFFTSLGFSYGGDEIVETDSGIDFVAGAGGHARLGYETLVNRRSGYRVALGLQYNATVSGGDDASLRENYLQLAYQYRADELVYGLGLVAQSGAEVTNDADDDIDYDAASGIFFYLENLDKHPLAGWGVSYTAIELDEEDSDGTADASRLELYYSWRFR